MYMISTVSINITALTEEVKQLCDKYKGVKLLEVLIQGVYAQLVEDCERSE